MKEKIKIIKLIIWATKIPFSYAKNLYIARFILALFKNSQFFLNAYIVSLLINSVIIEFQNPKGFNIENLYINLFIYFIVNVSYKLFFSIDDHLMSIISYREQVYRDLKLAQKVNSLGEEVLENPAISNIYLKATEGINSITRFVNNAVLDLIPKIITLIISGIALFFFNPLYILAVVIVTIPQIYFDSYFYKKYYEFDSVNAEDRRISRNALSEILTLSNFKEINLLNLYQFFEQKFLATRHKFILYYTDLEIKEGIFNSIVIIARGVLSSFVIYDLIKNTVKNISQVGNIQFGLSLVTGFMNNFDSIGGIYSGILGTSLRINDVKVFFDLEPESNVGKLEIDKFSISPGIEIKNLRFSYPNQDHEILKGINMNIQPGENIAIVGENGAGKSTLIKILSKFYTSYSGTILANGNELKDISPNSWYANLAVMFQDYNTYPSLTVTENIIVGDLNKKDDAQKYAKLATAHDFISDFKNGYDQILSEKIKGGVKPSGGQWQKIAIAKFLYRNAPVIIFDEPTSSIDAISEAQIFDNIFDSFSDKTVILISHRFSTVRRADRIFVLDKGIIAEAGTHAELLALNGIYATSFKLQADGYN